MKFGIFDHLDRSGAPLAEHYESRLRLAEAYDAAGFHAYHVAEHHSTPLGTAPSPNVFLATLASRTRRLRFGPLVYQLPLYHPLRLAEEICMLDHLSGGRLEVGVGRGASQHEIAYYGIDPAEAQARYFEAFAVVMKALSGEPLTFAGKFFRFTDTPVAFTPLQRPHPPLWYGAVNPEGAVWAAQNRVNIVCNVPAAGIRRITDRYRAEYAAAGHTAPLPLMAMNRYLVLADSDAEAMALGRRAYAVWHDSFYLIWRRHGTSPSNAAYPETFDQAVEQGYAVAGTPAHVRDTLTAQLEEAGSNYMVCRFAFGDLSLAESLRSLDLFARDAMPALQIL